MASTVPILSPPETHEPVSAGQAVRAGGSRLSGLGSLISGGLANRAMGTLRLLIFAPLLGPAAFGALRLATTASAILAALAGLGLSTSYLRYLPETDSMAESSAFLRRALGWSLAASCGIAVILILIPRGLAGVLFSDPHYWFLALLVAASLPLIVVYKSALGAAGGIGRFHHSAIGEGIQNLLYLVLGVGALVLVARESEVAFAAFLVGMAATAVWLSPRLPWRHVSGAGATTVRKKTDALFRRALKYSLWYALIPLFQYLFDFIDRWVLAHYRGLATTGAYSLIPILCGGMFVVGGALSAVVGRKGAELVGQGRGTAARRLVWGSLGIALLGSLVYVVGLRLVEPLIWKIAGPKWEMAAPVVPLFLAYFTFFNLYYLFGSFAFFAEKTWVHLLALAVGAGTNTVLNLIWVPQYGVTGAALATLLGLLAALGVQIVFIWSQRIRIVGKAWVVAALGFLPLLPRPYIFPAAGVVLLLAWKTNLVMNDSDRRMVAAWVGRIQRRFGRAAA